MTAVGNYSISLYCAHPLQHRWIIQGLEWITAGNHCVVYSNTLGQLFLFYQQLPRVLKIQFTIISVKRLRILQSVKTSRLIPKEHYACLNWHINPTAPCYLTSNNITSYLDNYLAFLMSWLLAFIWISPPFQCIQNKISDP